jgi:hypothetical protein
MADTLAAKTCSPCKGGIPPLTPQQAEGFHRQVPGWELRDDAHQLERKFKFRDFGEALRFVQRVGQLAEAEGHHPDISFGWGYAMRRSAYRQRRSNVCTRTISSWPLRSIRSPIRRRRSLNSLCY